MISTDSDFIGKNSSWFHRYCVIMLVITVALISCKRETSPKNTLSEEWIELLNGQNLDEWTVKIKGYEENQNIDSTFRVEDGRLKIRYDRYKQFDNRFGHLFYKTPYSYYKLRITYRFTGNQPPGAPEWAFKNSGVMFHAQSPERMGLDQDFPISIEYQLLGGDGESERPNANVCTPGTHIMADTLVTEHCIASDSKTYDKDEWLTVELIVHGHEEIYHILEGDTVLTYGQPQIGGGVVSGFDPKIKKNGKKLDSGYIALQSEGHPLDIRSVKMLNLEGCLDKSARNFREYFVKHNAGECRY